MSLRPLAAVLICASALCASAAPGAAQERFLHHDLAPELTSNRYTAFLAERLVRPVLLADSDVTLMLTRHSGELPETLSGVWRSGGRYQTHVADAAESIFHKGYVGPIGRVRWDEQRARSVPIRRASAPLSDAAAQRVGDLWERAIRTATFRGPDDHTGFDDDQIIVLRGTGDFTISANAFIPVSGSIASAVNRLGQAIAVHARGNADEADVLSACDRLEAVLDARLEVPAP